MSGRRTPYAFIRDLNDDGSLDEIVGHGDFHLEQLSREVWFLALGDVCLTIGIPIDRKRTVTAVPIDFNDWKAARAALNKTEKEPPLTTRKSRSRRRE